MTAAQKIMLRRSAVRERLAREGLELYAPLSDDGFENRAQSLSEVQADGRAVSATTEN